MTTVAEQIRDFNAGTKIELFEIDVSYWGEGILRFTPSGFEESDSGVKSFISFGGNEYVPFAAEGEGFMRSGRGSQPEPTLKLSVLSDVVRGLLHNTGGLVGAKLTRILTFANFLDGGADADVEQYVAKDVFFVNRMVSLDRRICELELTTILDLEGVQFPGGQALRNTCINQYRIWEESNGEFFYPEGRVCPYTGDNYFDKDDKETDAKNDQCSYTLTGCRLRFGETAELPIIAFPGLVRFDF